MFVFRITYQTKHGLEDRLLNVVAWDVNEAVLKALQEVPRLVVSGISEITKRERVVV